MVDKTYIHGIIDRFHSFVPKNTIVRSDDEAFRSYDDFYDWCKQHHANDGDIFIISPICQCGGHFAICNGYDEDDTTSPSYVCKKCGDDTQSV